MKCFLMNKNKKIALIEYNTNYNAITKIYEIYALDYAPLSLKNAVTDKSLSDVKELNLWFKGRGIPNWRKDLENLLKNLNVFSPDELLNKAYGLSLSDQYWIKSEKQKNLQWKDINFFTNDFQYKGYLQVSLSSSFSQERIDLYSPNNTTDGMLKKAWVIENNERILVKGTFYESRQEPINEWLVSQICKRLDLDYCNYEIGIENNKLVSKCKAFITENEEIITAHEVFNSKRQNNNINDFEHYIKILEENGISNARERLENMFFVDYLVMNIDRHMRNFGIIRNVETLKWERPTPIFDTGECMECNKLTNEMNFIDGKCKFFKNSNKDFSDLLKYIDISKYNISKLDGLAQDFKEKLIEYKNYTDMSDERIEKLYDGLLYRIQTINKSL